MFWYYINTSLVFAFIYFWFYEEQRQERVVFAAGYLVNAVLLVTHGIEAAAIGLSVLLGITTFVWYIGFKRGWAEEA